MKLSQMMRWLLYALSFPAVFALGFILAQAIGRYAGVVVAGLAAVAILSLFGLILVLRWRP